MQEKLENWLFVRCKIESRVMVIFKIAMQASSFTGESFIEALILASINPGHNFATRYCSLNSPKNTSSEHVVYKIFVLTFKTIFVRKML